MRAQNTDFSQGRRQSLCEGHSANIKWTRTSTEARENRNYIISYHPIVVPTTVSNPRLFAINNDEQPASDVEQSGYPPLPLWTKKNGRMTGRIAARIGYHPSQRSFLEERDPPLISSCSSTLFFGREIGSNSKISGVPVFFCNVKEQKIF